MFGRDGADTFIDEIVAGYALGFEATKDTMTKDNMWNIDVISQQATPEIIVSRLPDNTGAAIVTTAQPTSAGGKLHVFRPHVFRRFKVRGLAIPGESQTGTGDLTGTFNFSLVEELDAQYLPVRSTDFDKLNYAPATA